MRFSLWFFCLALACFFDRSQSWTLNFQLNPPHAYATSAASASGRKGRIHHESIAETNLWVSTSTSTCPLFDTSTSSVNRTATTVSQAESKVAVPRIPKRLGRASEIGFLVASLRGKPHKYLARLQKKHGENFIIRPNIVVLNDPKAIRDVLETHNLPKTPKVRFGYKSIFYGTRSRTSGGILAATWTKWIEQRRMAAPALSGSIYWRASA